MALMEVSEIAAKLNARASGLAPELLPNGRRAGAHWLASGIADHGKSESLQVNLGGSMVGHWTDHGNAAAGERTGDMLDLVRHKICGGDMIAAIAWAKRELGIADDFSGPRPELSQADRQRRADEARARAEAQEAQFAADREKKAKQARYLWCSGEPIAGTPAEDYLLARMISPVGEGERRWPRSLRFRPDAWFSPMQMKLPAMLGAVHNAAGLQIGCHRTFLAQTNGRWGKVDHPTAKMMLGNKAGGFVSIHKGTSGKSMAKIAEGEPVYVTEGIEDALCVRWLKPDARVVAAIDLGNIGAMILPAAVRELVIIADRDEGEKQQAALERAIAVQQARGLKVRAVVPPAEVNGLPVKDINDWVRAAAAGKKRQTG